MFRCCLRQSKYFKMYYWLGEERRAADVCVPVALRCWMGPGTAGAGSVRTRHTVPPGPPQQLPFPTFYLLFAAKHFEGWSHSISAFATWYILLESTLAAGWHPQAQIIQCARTHRPGGKKLSHIAGLLISLSVSHPSKKMTNIKARQEWFLCLRQVE